MNPSIIKQHHTHVTITLKTTTPITLRPGVFIHIFPQSNVKLKTKKDTDAARCLSFRKDCKDCKDKKFGVSWNMV